MDRKSNTSIVNFASFVVLIIAAVLLVVGSLLNGSDLYSILMTLKDVFVLVIIAFAAYRYVANKTKTWKIIYWVCIAVYVVGIVLPWIIK